MRLVAALVVVSALSACSSSPTRRFREAPKAIALEPNAEYVELVSFVSEDRLKDFEEVKTIECRMGMNFSDAQANVEACENFLRNEALASDAAIAWVKPEWKRIGAFPGCANCVEMRAMLLTPVPPSRRSAMRR